MTIITRHSRALVSVAAALFLLSGGLRTLTSSGISLRLARALLEITVALWRFPKAMKNMVANGSLFFYRSRMLYEVVSGRAFSFSGGLRTLTSSGIFLARALLEFTVLREIPEGDEKYGRLTLFFYRSTSCGGSHFHRSRMTKWGLFFYRSRIRILPIPTPLIKPQQPIIKPAFNRWFDDLEIRGDVEVAGGE